MKEIRDMCGACNSNKCCFNKVEDCVEYMEYIHKFYLENSSALNNDEMEEW